MLSLFTVGCLLEAVAFAGSLLIGCLRIPPASWPPALAQICNTWMFSVFGALGSLALLVAHSQHVHVLAVAGAMSLGLASVCPLTPDGELSSVFYAVAICYTLHVWWLRGTSALLVLLALVLARSAIATFGVTAVFDVLGIQLSDTARTFLAAITPVAIQPDAALRFRAALQWLFVLFLSYFLVTSRPDADKRKPD